MAIAYKQPTTFDNYTMSALDKYLQEDFSFISLFIFNNDHQIQYSKNGDSISTNPSLLSSLMACMMALQSEVFQQANKSEELLTNITMQSGTDELKIMKYKENLNGKSYIYYLLYSGSTSYAELLLNDITFTLNESMIMKRLVINEYAVDLKITEDIDKIIEGLLTVYANESNSMLNWI